MKTYYTYTDKDKEPTDNHPKILSTKQLFHEVNIDHESFKYDLYKVIQKNEKLEPEYKKICMVNEFEYTEFDK